MVAMQMRDEDIVESGGFYGQLTHGVLGTFTTIYHENLVAHLQELRRRIILKGGQRAATAKYG